MIWWPDSCIPRSLVSMCDCGYARSPSDCFNQGWVPGGRMRPCSHPVTVNIWLFYVSLDAIRFIIPESEEVSGGELWAVKTPYVQ